MFRVWAKEIKKGKILRDTVVIDERENINRTKMVTDALFEVCNRLDLAVPVWLEHNINEFKYSAKTRFNSDNFMEEIEFDYLEFKVLEEVTGLVRR